MPKYNKKRNTALLYEILIREVIKLAVDGNKDYRNRVISTLKEHFKRESEIGKELQLFKNIVDTQGLLPYTAEKLIQETKKEYKKLDTKKIFKEQSVLINVINKNLSKNIFSNFVPNYKDIATLSQIFGKNINTKKRVILEESLLKKMTAENTTKKIKNTRLSNVVVNKFVEKFNNKYSNTLLENQKQLLNKFILSFLDRGADFKVYLNEEIENLKKKVNDSFELEELKKDNALALRMKEVKELLEASSQKPINKEFLQQILKIQTLSKEIDS